MFLIQTHPLGTNVMRFKVLQRNKKKTRETKIRHNVRDKRISIKKLTFALLLNERSRLFRNLDLIPADQFQNISHSCSSTLVI